MRTATNGQYPRFAVWENVPGAFSSNGGEDFRAVLEEITEAEIPMPTSGKWANAGMVRTDTVDLAWRVLDAQYWGVPQRRRRIFLVADFGGQCAGEILFVEPCLRGHSAESGETREEVAAATGDSVEEPNCLTSWDCQSKRIYGINSKWPTLYSGEGGGAKNQAVLISRINSTPEGIAGTVSSKWAKGTGGPAGDEHYNLAVVPQLYDMTHAEEVIRPVQEGIAPTLNSRMGTGGNQVPVMLCLADQGGQQIAVHSDISPTLRAQEHGHQPCVCIQNATRGKSQNGLGISQDDVSYTLDSLGNHAVAYPEPANTLLGKSNLSFRGDADTIVAVDCRNLCENEELSGTLQCKQTGGYSLNYQNPVRIGYAVRRLTPLECERLQGFPDNWTNIPGASDTARYKAIGNSVAIPCVMFVLGGIARVLKRDKVA